MNTFVWGTTASGFGLGGDWNSAPPWAGGVVPDGADAAVLTGAPGNDSVTITAGETEAVNTLPLTRSATNLTGNGTIIDNGGSLGTTQFGSAKAGAVL
jgi:hypothetical protein